MDEVKLLSDSFNRWNNRFVLEKIKMKTFSIAINLLILLYNDRTNNINVLFKTDIIGLS